MSSLSALLRAADSLRDPHESFGIMIVESDGAHRVRVVVGRETAALVTAPTRAEAVALALEAIDDTRCVEACAEACGE